MKKHVWLTSHAATKIVMRYRNKYFSVSELKYRNTRAKFKKAHGIDAEHAPHIFQRDDMLYILLHTQHRSRITGRINEYLKYIPYCNSRGVFKSLERKDIKI